METNKRKMTLGFIGDSITAGVGATSNENRWSTVLCKALDANEINLAVSGSVLSDSPRYYCERQRLAELTPCDILFVALGINDWQVACKDGKTIVSPSNAVPGASYCGPGSPDSDDTSTLYGAMKRFCSDILEKKKTEGFENTRVIFLTPLVMAENPCQINEKYHYEKDLKNIYGSTIKDYCNIISKVAASFGLDVIDTHELAGIYYNSEEDSTADELLNDGLHPNDKGHKKIAEAVLKNL